MPVHGKDRSFGLATDESVRSNVDHSKWDNDHYFHDLPDPTGKSPFHLDLADVLALEDIKEIEKNGLVFHTAGDTGNIHGKFQEEVAKTMVEDADKSKVSFFYHLGDVVYDYGEDREFRGSSMTFIRTTITRFSPYPEIMTEHDIPAAPIPSMAL